MKKMMERGKEVKKSKVNVKKGKEKTSLG